MAQVDVLSEINGSVWKILVKLGDAVAEDDLLLIVESMKMEIPVLAPATGTVQEVLVTEGQAVSEGLRLLVITQ